MKKPVLVNGTTGEAVSTKSPAQLECIKLLEQALESANNGDLHAIVLVGVGPFDFGVAFAGTDAARMYMGCGVAQRTLLERTTPGPSGRTVLHR